MKFETLNIDEKLKMALKMHCFEDMTEIQEKTIECILDGKDVVGQSKTGSGKTAAFLIPILQNIDLSKNYLQALILCPTRELAMQVYEEARKFTTYMSEMKILCIYGGESIEKQIIQLRRGVHIAIATPGRVIDHIRRKTIKLGTVNKLILDEADEMLKMGFDEDIDKILEYISKDRQTVLFSATFNDKIKSKFKEYLKNPKIVTVKDDTLGKNDISQHAICTKTKMKNEALERVIKYYEPNKCTVFCNTKKEVENVLEYLNKVGIVSMAIYSDIRQEQRSIIMKRFKEGSFNVLVATDVAARGLDIPNLDLVINYDIPKEDELYIHRIGRTGRNGAKGTAITFVVGKEKDKIQKLEEYANSNIDFISLPTLNELKGKKDEEILTKIGQIILNGSYSDLSLYEKICKENNHNYKEISKALYTMLFEEKYKRSMDDEDSNKMIKLFFSVGKENMIKAKDIVGAVAGNTGLIGSQIGKIDVMDKFSFVEVPAKYVDEVIYKLNGSYIKGRRVEIEIARS